MRRMLMPMLLLGATANSMAGSGCLVNRPFGTTKDGTTAQVFTLTSASGVAVDVSSYGACITRLVVPDRDGKCEDIVLGCDDAAAYEAHDSYFGAIVGRVANRIRDGKFMLHGRFYQLVQNDNGNTLHGGKRGFDKQHWSYEEVPNGVKLTLTSPDGDQGYPGEVNVSAIYTLEGNTLQLDMQGEAETATPLNLAQHSYFNLCGHASGQSILSHSVKLYCHAYTPLRGHLPTGQVAFVGNSPFDFSAGVSIGSQIEALGASLGITAYYDCQRDIICMPAEVEADGENKFLGFDDNFIVDGLADSEGLRKVALVSEPISGRTLLVESDAPGVQFYTGNFLGGTSGKDGAIYHRHGGFCLETQHFPDSVGADPKTCFGRGACRIIDASRSYAHSIRYTFGLTGGETALRTEGSAEMSHSQKMAADVRCWTGRTR